VVKAFALGQVQVWVDVALSVVATGRKARLKSSVGPV